MRKGKKLLTKLVSTLVSCAMVFSLAGPVQVFAFDRADYDYLTGEDYEDAVELEIGDTGADEYVAENEYVIYKITPTETKNYYIYSDCKYDAEAALVIYDFDNEEIYDDVAGLSDTSDDNYNFSAYIKLEADTTYYLIVWFYDDIIAENIKVVCSETGYNFTTDGQDDYEEDDDEASFELVGMVDGNVVDDCDDITGYGEGESVPLEVNAFMIDTEAEESTDITSNCTFRWFYEDEDEEEGYDVESPISGATSSKYTVKKGAGYQGYVCEVTYDGEVEIFTFCLLATHTIDASAGISGVDSDKITKDTEGVDDDELWYDIIVEGGKDVTLSATASSSISKDLVFTWLTDNTDPESDEEYITLVTNNKSATVVGSSVTSTYKVTKSDDDDYFEETYYCIISDGNAEYTITYNLMLPSKITVTKTWKINGEQTTATDVKATDTIVLNIDASSTLEDAECEYEWFCDINDYYYELEYINSNGIFVGEDDDENIPMPCKVKSISDDGKTVTITGLSEECNIVCEVNDGQSTVEAKYDFYPTSEMKITTSTFNKTQNKESTTNNVGDVFTLTANASLNDVDVTKDCSFTWYYVYDPEEDEYEQIEDESSKTCDVELDATYMRIKCVVTNGDESAVVYYDLFAAKPVYSVTSSMDGKDVNSLKAIIGSSVDLAVSVTSDIDKDMFHYRWYEKNGKDEKALGNSNDKTQIAFATGDKAATRTVICRIFCGDIYEDEDPTEITFTIDVKLPCEHNDTEVINEKAATCVDEGYSGDVKCKTCGEVIENGHATEKNPDNHESTTIKNAKKATEKSKGYTGDTYCVKCGTKLADGEEIDVIKKDSSGEENSTEEEDISPAPKAPANGTSLTANGVTFKVTKAGVTGGEVEYTKTSSKKTSITIPATVKIDGITYKVTSIAPKAFKNNKKLKKIVIGKNIKKIGKQAFYKCKKLSKIIVKTKLLTKKSVGKQAFTGTAKKGYAKVPKKQLKSYKKIFKARGYKAKVKK